MVKLVYMQPIFFPE
uniref:Uncharacterized protein n=1 Tax=Anguilla anguilla TaxID=7936 RepID=A0A0E9XPC7_ANGAN